MSAAWILGLSSEDGLKGSADGRVVEPFKVDDEAIGGEMAMISWDDEGERTEGMIETLSGVTDNNKSTENHVQRSKAALPAEAVIHPWAYP